MNVQTGLEIKQRVTVFQPATERHFFTNACSSLQEKLLWLCLETQENDLIRLEVMPPHPLGSQSPDGAILILLCSRSSSQKCNETKTRQAHFGYSLLGKLIPML